MRANQIKLVAVLWLLPNVGFVAAGVAAVDVRLRDNIVPKSAVVRLGDVAEINSADRQEARRLAAVPLMPAPAPETRRFLRKQEIADMLAANGVDLAGIRFDGSEQVAVVGRDAVRLAAFEQPVELTNQAATVPRSVDSAASFGVPKADAVKNREAILAGAKSQSFSAQLDDAQADALKSVLCRIIGEYVKTKTGRTAVGRVDCNVTQRQLELLALATSAPVCDGGNNPWTGRQTFVLSYAAADGPTKLTVSADISEPAMPTVVVTRGVARGSVITAADVELRSIEPNAKSSGPRVTLSTVESVIGKEARQALQPGDLVFADLVQSPLLVKRGDLVNVSSRTGSIRVRTSARSLQDGATGDLIQVESLESKQRYDARVVGVREAAVFSPTRVSSPEKPLRLEAARSSGYVKTH